MKGYIFMSKYDSRELKKFIVMLLKSGVANKIQKINYGQSFCLCDKKVEKSESKLIIIYSENKENLLKFIQKNSIKLEFVSIES